jgi:hypothetical protein
VTVQEIVIERDRTSVVEDDGTVFSGDGLAPPLVVDAPGFTDGFDFAGWLSGDSDEDGLPLFVRAHVHGSWATERAEVRCVAHGSKLSSA